jgi:hypothetical protein
LKLLKALILVPIVSVVFVGAQIAPASAAVSATINGKSKPFPNAKAGEVVMVAAGPGSFPSGDTIGIVECNAASDPFGSGCDLGGGQSTIANADGSVSPVSYTLKAGAMGTDATLTCLPPSSANISAGVSCVMRVVDIDNTAIVGAVPFLDVAKISAGPINSYNKVVVTCKQIGNIGTTYEKVDFKRNGVVVATVANSNGTVKAKISAATGDTVQCFGELFRQKSKILTL